jgi:hypothetical protein
LKNYLWSFFNKSKVQLLGFDEINTEVEKELQSFQGLGFSGVCLVDRSVGVLGFRV